MTTYTITITADDDSAATTRLRLDTSGDQVILTDLHLHDGNGLSTGQLPAIDYGLLLAAITTSTPTPLSGRTPHARGRDTTPAPTAVTASTPARRRARTAAPAAAAAATPQPAVGGRRRAGAGNKAAAAANKSVPRARKTTTKAKTAKADRQAGSASAAAEHYQVPRHTANGWIRRLREQGIIPAGR